GMRPPCGVGALMSGSTFGGQITPSERASFSLSGWSSALPDGFFTDSSLPAPTVALACSQARLSVCCASAGALMPSRTKARTTLNIAASSTPELRRRNNCQGGGTVPRPSRGMFTRVCSLTPGSPAGAGAGASPQAHSNLFEADQREMAERRHRPALDQPHLAVARRPIGQKAEAEFRSPAEPPRARREALFEHRPRPALGTDMID